MAKISILMATTDGKIAENSSFLKLPFSAELKAIVVNQKIKTTEDLTIENEFISVFNSYEKGISNSRNLALSKADTDYVHFCDDDVVFVNDYFTILQEAIKEYSDPNFFQFEIITLEGEPFKKYPLKKHNFNTNTIINKRKILLMSSVEIVSKLKFIRQYDLKFSPEFGVGSEQFPMGEEALFLMDALAKNAHFQFIPKPIVVHPKESSGSRLGKAELHTLGFLFRRVYGTFSGIFNFYYALKKRNELNKNNISIAQAVKWMKPEVIL